MPRSKPYPDVYLAAAQGLGVMPERCVVVEDTTTGVTAGVAAGSVVLAYAPAGGDDALRAAGAMICFQSMQQLPELVAGLLSS
jgi:beta-phosphoglucomutase-like phosphatase (HAD superfamily)